MKTHGTSRLLAVCAGIVLLAAVGAAQAGSLEHYWEFEYADGRSFPLWDTAQIYEESAGSAYEDLTPVNAAKSNSIEGRGAVGRAVTWEMDYFNWLGGSYDSSLTDLGNSFTF